MSGLRIRGAGPILRAWAIPAAAFLLATSGIIFLAYKTMQSRYPVVGAGMITAEPSAKADVDEQEALVNLRQDQVDQAGLQNATAVQMTPELHMQRMRERAFDLDLNFREDPRDQSWAGPMEARIRQAIASSGFVGEEEYGISSHSTDCRSHGCRIELVFQDDMMTDEATMFIRRELAGSLNETLTVPLSRPDGSIEYRIYAVSPGHGALLRKRRSDERLGESVSAGP